MSSLNVRNIFFHSFYMFCGLFATVQLSSGCFGSYLFKAPMNPFVLISQLPKTDFCWFKRPLKILCINSRSRPPRCVSCVMNKYLSIVSLSQSDFVFRSNYILDSFCNTSKCTVTTPLKKWKLPKLNLNLDRINCKVRYLFIKIAFKKWPIYHSRECMFSTNSHIILNSHLLLLQ